MLQNTQYLPDGTRPQAISGIERALQAANTGLNQLVKGAEAADVPKKLKSWLTQFQSALKERLKKSLQFRHFPEVAIS
ncbi:hypothetical protein K1718_10920 [Roseibium porphyridii]|uniref:Transposase n=1 Tax=Roseibium porphyridii TaxID=2866279 RepID=A0ABY8F8L4_9HYPH|nr:hypothetical protein [Roseibium sp. KMA01]WFE91843.1 hypothetical protein K1718_10920 [Roseibium sp. KMA01]